MLPRIFAALVALLITGVTIADDPTRFRPKATALGEDPKRAIDCILVANITPEERMAALEKYVDVCDSFDDARKFLEPLYFSFGDTEAATYARHGPMDTKLLVEARADGKVTCIAVVDRGGKWEVLRGAEDFARRQALDEAFGPRRDRGRRP